jgi:fructosamine-3-kinase
MIPQKIRQYIKSLHKKELNNLTPVGGGSINEAYRYSVEEDVFFLKYNGKVDGIIAKEVDGLMAIAKLNSIATPGVIAFEKIDQYEILILPFIKHGLRTSTAWKNSGYQLAKMHKKPAPHYGWHQSNFIGSLHQNNEPSPDFISFFINQRLNPQLKLARDKNLLSGKEIQEFDLLFSKLNEILPDTTPSLVHGDLWSGNFMIGEGHTPYLIDPSVHFNFRETDLAFTHLFGGFDSIFYEAYQDYFPMAPGFSDRVSLYNLYPLLVHLNLFGSGYYRSVIINLHQYVR